MSGRKSAVLQRQDSEEDFSGSEDVDEVAYTNARESDEGESDEEMSDDKLPGGDEESEEEFVASDDEDEPSIELVDSSDEEKEVGSDDEVQSEEEAAEEEDEDEGAEDAPGEGSEELPVESLSEEEEDEEFDNAADEEEDEKESDVGDDESEEEGEKDDKKEEKVNKETKKDKSVKKILVDTSSKNQKKDHNKVKKSVRFQSAPVAIPQPAPSKTASTMSDSYTAKQLDEMTVPKLKEIATKVGSTVKGKKAEIIAAILAVQKPTEAAAEPSAAAPSAPAPPSAPPSAPSAEPSTTPSALYTAEQLGGMTLPELKKAASAIGAKTTGKKADVIAAILAAQPQPEATEQPQQEAAEQPEVEAVEVPTAKQLGGMTLPELKKIASAVGAKTTGKKADVIAAILDAQKGTAPPAVPPAAPSATEPSSAAPAPSVVEPPSVPAPSAAPPVPAPSATTSESYTAVQLGEKLLPELKKIASAVGVKTTGKKADVIAAILKAQESAAPNAAEEITQEPVKPVQTKSDVFSVDPASLSKRFGAGGALAVGGTLKVRPVTAEKAEVAAEGTGATQTDKESQSKDSESVSEEVAKKSGGDVKGRKKANKLLLGVKYSKD